MSVLTADGAILGARIHSLDPGAPPASAIAWRGDEVIAIGGEHDVEPVLGEATERFDGTGRTVVPGLTDSHVHPFLGTDSTRGVDLRGCESLDEVISLLRAENERLKPGEWTLGHSMGYDIFSRDRPLSLESFAEASPGRPLHIRLFDGHTDFANEEALAAAGIDGPREFKSASAIVCDADGRPTGALRELAAMDLIRNAMPEPNRDQRLAAYAETLRSMAATGLSGAHVMSGGRDLLELVSELERSERLPLRLVMPLRNEPETSDAEIEARLGLADTGGRLWTVRTAKFFLDGVIEAGTAWLTDPGPDGVNQAPFWKDPDRFRELVRRYTEAGFSCACHAVGDGAVHAALDAYEETGPPRRGMHRVEHIETLIDEDLERFSKLDVAASMQPLHMEGLDLPDHADAWREKLAPGRLERAFLTRSISNTGAEMALGSDWMVADYDPRIGMAWSMLRRRPSGLGAAVPMLAEEALDAGTTLAGYTTVPARIAGDERGGRLAPGMHADLSLWAADPLETAPDSLPELPVELTVTGGTITHRGASA